MIAKDAPTRQFDVVLCDMDGTLVDTEVLSEKARVSVCSEKYDFEISEDEREMLVGRTDEDAMALLFSARNLKHDITEAVSTVHEVYECYLQTDMQPYKPTMSFLEVLRSIGKPCGLVSGSTANQVNMVVDALHCRDVFDVIVTDDDVEHSKPHPESYLRAAKLLNVLPNQCLVIEDSVTGITSAKDAGMFCIAVKNNYKADQSKADMFIQDLSELDLRVFC